VEIASELGWFFARDLSGYEGKWVSLAVEAQEIVCESSKFADVLAESKKQRPGIVPTIIRVESDPLFH